MVDWKLFCTFVSLIERVTRAEDRSSHHAIHGKLPSKARELENKSKKAVEQEQESCRTRARLPPKPSKKTIFAQIKKKKRGVAGHMSLSPLFIMLNIVRRFC